MTFFITRLSAPWMLMLWGLLFSYAGSSIISGAVPTMVATGLIGAGWIPLYSSLATLSNGAAWLIAQLLRNTSPYRMLLLCEGYDAVLTLIALGLYATHHTSQIHIVLAYIILVSVIPVVTNIANNVYAGTLSLMSDAKASRFNGLTLCLVTLATLVLGKPLGSLLMGVSFYLVLGLNLLLTLSSFCFRICAMRRDTLYKEAERQQQALKASHPLAGFSLLAGLRHFKGRILCLSASSPLTTAVIYLGLGLYLYYLPLWLAQDSQHQGVIVAASGFCGGLGSLLGPLLFMRLKQRFTYRTQVAAAAAGVATSQVIMLLVAMLHGNTTTVPAMGIYLLLFFATYLAAAYCNIANLSARQTRYAGIHYHHMVGLSYSFNCLLTLAGTWLGYWMHATTQPLFVLLLAICISALCAASVLFRRDNEVAATTGHQ